MLDQKAFSNASAAASAGDVFTLAMKLEESPLKRWSASEIAGMRCRRTATKITAMETAQALYQITARTARFTRTLRSSGGADARAYLQGRAWAR